MTGLLQGKVVVVTGASGDIGSEVAFASAKEGASVIATYNRGRERALAVVDRSKTEGYSIEAKELDVRNEEAVERFFEEVDGRRGPLDSLINVAGHSSRETWFATMDELDEGKWLEVIRVDLLGTFFCCREGAKHMKEGGSIVNFSSAAGVTGHSEGLPYTAAKAAVIGLTKSLAMMLGPKIRVNAVAPGNIEAGSIAWYGPKERAKMADEAFLKRIGTALEVAESVLFLASDRASFITGQVLLVDGGI
jgi:3-oxoacyl-[acyl-carrier protein] reductase